MPDLVAREPAGRTRPNANASRWTTRARVGGAVLVLVGFTSGAARAQETATQLLESAAGMPLERAVAALQEGLERIPPDAAVEYRLGLYLQLLGRFPEALTAYERCGQLSDRGSSKEEACLLGRITTLLRLERPEEAADIAGPLTASEHPRVAWEARRLLMKTHEAQGDLAAAAALLAELRPAPTPQLEDLAQLEQVRFAMLQGDEGRAELTLDAVANALSQPQERLFAALAYASMGRFQSARELAGRVDRDSLPRFQLPLLELLLDVLQDSWDETLFEEQRVARPRETAVYMLAALAAWRRGEEDYAHWLDLGRDVTGKALFLSGSFAMSGETFR